MGRDKASIEFAGERLADRAARVLSAVASPVLEAGPGLTGLPSFVETPPGSGPLAALAEAGRRLREDGHTGAVLVLAVDHVRVQAPLLRLLASQLGTASVVPSRAAATSPCAPATPPPRWRRPPSWSRRASGRCRPYSAPSRSSASSPRCGAGSPRPTRSRTSTRPRTSPGCGRDNEGDGPRGGPPQAQRGRRPAHRGRRRRGARGATGSRPRSRWRSACRAGPGAPGRRGHDAHARQRLRARGRIPASPRASSPPSDVAAIAYCERPARGAALQRRDGPPAAARSTPSHLERNFVRRPRLRHLRQGRARRRSRCAARRSRRRPGRRAAVPARRCPTRCARRSACSTRTGGLHAAGAVRRRRARSSRSREDVGRHNAVDKVVGDAAARGRAAARATRCCWCRGRLSFEIVQKAAVAGIPVLCAVSAPSSLAVEAAERLGMTVVGFLRGDALQRVRAPRADRPGWLTAPTGRRSSAAEAPAADLWVGLAAERHRRGEAEPLPRDARRRSGRTGDALPYAWRILRKGVCDGCALGVAGFHDWTIDGVHLCTTRLNLLRLNTMGALRPRACSPTSRALRGADGRRAARRSGGSPYPMVRRRGEPGFTRVSVGRGARPGRRRASARADPDRVGFYLTARGITNEVYYVAQKVGALPRHQQRRQRRARLPRAVDRRAQDDDRRRRHDVLATAT